MPVENGGDGLSMATAFGDGSLPLGAELSSLPEATSPWPFPMPHSVPVFGPSRPNSPQEPLTFQECGFQDMFDPATIIRMTGTGPSPPEQTTFTQMTATAPSPTDQLVLMNMVTALLSASTTEAHKELLSGRVPLSLQQQEWVLMLS